MDTAIGINQEFLPHIFARFHQADSTTTRAYGGLGLGLAIAAKSAGDGKGATFSLKLPLVQVAKEIIAS